MPAAAPELEAIEAVLAHVLRQAQISNAAEIKGVHLALGELSAFTKTSITAAWNAVSAGTAAEGTPLHFRVVTAAAQCMTCFRPYRPDEGTIRCPFCGAVGAMLIAGAEFHVEAIDFA